MLVHDQSLGGRPGVLFLQTLKGGGRTWCWGISVVSPLDAGASALGALHSCWVVAHPQDALSRGGLEML